MGGAQRAHRVTKGDGDKAISCLDEILEKLNELTISAPEGVTIKQMIEATGHSQKWCRAEMNRLITAGLAMCNGRVRRPRIDGQMAYVPVYLVKK